MHLFFMTFVSTPCGVPLYGWFDVDFYGMDYPLACVATNSDTPNARIQRVLAKCNCGNGVVVTYNDFGSLLYVWPNPLSQEI